MSYLELRDAINHRFGKVSLLRPLFEWAQGLDFGYRYLLHRKLNRDTSTVSTREIFVEWANYCNLRCSFCALDHFQPKKRMSLETWELFLREITSDPRFRKVEVIHLHNGGETLLHPQFDEMLALLDRYKLQTEQLGSSFPKVEILTNGMLLNEKRRKSILQCKAIQKVGLSMDGGSPEDFESIRIRAKWDVFTGHFEALVRENAEIHSPKKIFLISVFTDEEKLKLRKFHPDFDRMLQLADRSELRLVHDWGGQVELDGNNQSNQSKWHKWGCNMMMDQLVLLPDGSVSLCCNDLNGKGVVGNLHKDGLYGAYTSLQRTQWLDQMAKNKTDEIELCQSCERF